jgi:hypothetical protein
MNMMDSIASAAMDISAAQMSVDYSMAVTKKVMDTQDLAGQEMDRMLQYIDTPAKGEYIDVYA